MIHDSTILTIWKKDDKENSKCESEMPVLNKWRERGAMK